jgi:hypothetical protein
VGSPKLTTCGKADRHFADHDVQDILQRCVSAGIDNQKTAADMQLNRST